MAVVGIMPVFVRCWYRWCSSGRDGGEGVCDGGDGGGRDSGGGGGDSDDCGG